MTGNVAVNSPTSPSAVLAVTGSGSVTADFSVTPPTTTVWFNSSSFPESAVAVSDGEFYSNLTPATTVAEGGSIDLAPGVYGIQAAPSSGSAFASWSISSSQSTAGSVAAALSPVTWLSVSGASSNLGLRVGYQSTVATVSVNLTGFGDGTVSLNGSSFPYNSGTGYSDGLVSLSAGNYPASAVPAPGWTFVNWSYVPSAYLVDFNQSTNVSFEPGVAALTATFAANITTFESPVNDGRIALNGAGPLVNATVSALPRGLYSLNALVVRSRHVFALGRERPHTTLGAQGRLPDYPRVGERDWFGHRGFREHDQRFDHVPQFSGRGREDRLQLREHHGCDDHERHPRHWTLPRAGGHDSRMGVLGLDRNRSAQPDGRDPRC